MSENLRVKDLIKILQTKDPELFIAVGVSKGRGCVSTMKAKGVREKEFVVEEEQSGYQGLIELTPREGYEMYSKDPDLKTAVMIHIHPM